MSQWRRLPTKERAILLRARFRNGVNRWELRGKEQQTAAEMERSGLLQSEEVVDNQSNIDYGKRMAFAVTPTYTVVYKPTVRGNELLALRGKGK